MDEREELVERSGPGRRESDKPSPWQNPGLWVSILSLLLTVCIIIGGFMSKQLSDLHSDMTNLMLSTTRTNTQQAEEIKTLQSQMQEEKVERKKEHDDQNAYNYDLNGKLIKITTRLEDGKR